VRYSPQAWNPQLLSSVILGHVNISRDHSKVAAIPRIQLEGIFLPSDDALSAFHTWDSKVKCFIAIIITKRTIWFDSFGNRNGINSQSHLSKDHGQPPSIHLPTHPRASRNNIFNFNDIPCPSYRLEVDKWILTKKRSKCWSCMVTHCAVERPAILRRTVRNVRKGAELNFIRLGHEDDIWRRSRVDTQQHQIDLSRQTFAQFCLH
jgi:hypothetical protein